MPYLEALGFHIVGYGCTTCIGNSGPLPEPVADAVTTGDLVVAAVLSGNRNFEGRINPHVRMNYLASPPLVVAYALAGEVDTRPGQRAAGHRPQRPAGVPQGHLALRRGDPATSSHSAVKPEQFRSQYAHAHGGRPALAEAASPGGGNTFKWDPKSTYVRKPTFFENIPTEPKPLTDIKGARVLALLGDSVTTDHISPAGNIAKTSPAAQVPHGRRAWSPRTSTPTARAAATTR